MKPYFTLPREGGLPLFNDAHALIRHSSMCLHEVRIVAHNFAYYARIAVHRHRDGRPSSRKGGPRGRIKGFGTVGAGMKLGRSARQGVDLAPRYGNAEPSPPAIDPSHTGPTRRPVWLASSQRTIPHYALHEEQETTSPIFCFVFECASEILNPENLPTQPAFPTASTMSFEFCAQCGFNDEKNRTSLLCLSMYRICRRKDW